MERWSHLTGIAKGAVVLVQQAWDLSRLWYPDRLSHDWSPKTALAMEAIFLTVGLTGAFWKVR